MKNNILKLTEDNDIEGVKKAIAEGVDVNFQDEYGKTALIIASHFGYSKIVKLLIKEAGADLNIKYACGRTALIKASDWKRDKVIKLLVEAGADRDIKNNTGRTALDFAKKERDRHQEIVELLTAKNN